MGVVRSISATLTLMEAEGRPVPAGASARVGEAAGGFPVARQGRVYVSGSERASECAAGRSASACRATVELPKDRPGSTLGSYTCMQ